jgi:membrane protease YdiL (CAAX protease family)
MQPTSSKVESFEARSRFCPTLVIILALAVFCALFVAADQGYNHFVNQYFPNLGESAAQANIYGVASRLHMLIPAALLVLWRPRLFGFQFGSAFKNWRLILLLLAVNCAVIGGYLWLSGGTPYSGDQWFLTEVVTVPIVEETIWRGLVFAVLYTALKKYHPDPSALRWTVVLSGAAFGLLHAANYLAGIPLQFVALQTLNAFIWGLVYGYVRARTDSIYPPMLMHAAMNLLVVLF